MADEVWLASLQSVAACQALAGRAVPKHPPRQIRPDQVTLTSIV
jgi:hypothetical protein